MGAEHGTRSRYVMGCRCAGCTEVACAYAREYYHARKRETKVSTDRARLRIEWLREKGLGYVSIAEACDMGPRTVMLIARGDLKTILKSTEARLLEVTPEAAKDGCLVPAGPTLGRIAELREEGFRLKSIARALGSKQVDALKGGLKHVTVRTESRILRLYLRAMKDANVLR